MRLKCILIFLVATAVATPAWAQSKETFGWVEKVHLTPSNVVLHAKLDTGADGASLDASNLKEFEKNGKTWVRFKLTNRYGQSVQIEREIRRIATVKRHRNKSQHRKVIRMGICLGNKYIETDISLIDRRNFHYQLLLGRVFLAGIAVIDPSVTYTSEPNCKKQSEQ